MHPSATLRTAREQTPLPFSVTPASAAVASARHQIAAAATSPSPTTPPQHKSSVRTRPRNNTTTAGARRTTKTEQDAATAAGLHARSLLTGEQAIQAALKLKADAQLGKDGIPSMDLASPLLTIPRAQSASPSAAPLSRGSWSDASSSSSSSTSSKGSHATKESKDQMQNSEQDGQCKHSAHAEVQATPLAEFKRIVSKSVTQEEAAQQSDHEARDTVAYETQGQSIIERCAADNHGDEDDLGEEEKTAYMQQRADAAAQGTPMEHYGTSMPTPATAEAVSSYASLSSLDLLLPGPAPLESVKSDESTASDRDPSIRTPTQEDRWLALHPKYCGCGALAEKYCWTCHKTLCTAHKNEQHYNAEVRHQIYALQYAMRIIRTWLKEANVSAQEDVPSSSA